MIFKELTYSVWEIISGYHITDDSEYSLKQIEEIMLGMNQTLIREAYNNKHISQSLYVMDSFIEVKKMEHSVVAQGIPLKADGKFCKAELNELVAGVGQKDLSYFGSSDLSRNYSRKTLRGLINGDSGTLWSLYTPSYALSDNIAYMDAHKLSGAKYVTVIGLWNDPRKASGYDENKDFPTPSEYKLQMLTIQHMFVGKNIPPDLISNAQREFGQMGQRQQRREPVKEEK
jgi:hypothetical protein